MCAKNVGRATNIDKYLDVSGIQKTSTSENCYSFAKKRAFIFSQPFFYSQPGRYTFLKDIKTLRSVMATYYNLFALGKQLNPIVSVPYIDAFGTGTI